MGISTSENHRSEAIVRTRMVTTDPTLEPPSQREILRRLQLVGGAPASYFADACRLMAKEPPLESQTQLVSRQAKMIGAVWHYC